MWADGRNWRKKNLNAGWSRAQRPGIATKEGTAQSEVSTSSRLFGGGVYKSGKGMGCFRFLYRLAWLSGFGHIWLVVQSRTVLIPGELPRPRETSCNVRDLQYHRPTAEGGKNYILLEKKKIINICLGTITWGQRRYKHRQSLSCSQDLQMDLLPCCIHKMLNSMVWEDAWVLLFCSGCFVLLCFLFKM